MKSTKLPTAEPPSHRRSQPIRQTRTNPPRSSVNATRSSNARDSFAGGPMGDQPIDVFPAITHFADTITALPKELVRHFTLLKEVDAKIFTPEEQLFKLVAAARLAPLPEAHWSNNALSATLPESAPSSTQCSSGEFALSIHQQTTITTNEKNSTAVAVFDPSNFHRRQLFRQTAFKIQEMLVSLEEKNHVLTTANEALQRQLARVENVWPYLENEFSDEAKWGSTTHWAYPENRNGKASQAERARRDGAAAISAAAQALAEQAAARSDARKQAVQAKKNMKTQAHDSEGDEHETRQKDQSKRTQPSKVRKTAEANASVGLGITTATLSNGNPPQKRRKVEKAVNGNAITERAMSSVFGNNAPKVKAISPQATPVPEPPKKRKALPNSSGQAKKKNGPSVMSPSTTSPPVMGPLPEPKAAARPSPGPPAPTRPTSSRARQNSLQSGSEAAKMKPQIPAAHKVNGIAHNTPEPSQQSTMQRPVNEPKPLKETAVMVKVEPPPKDAERPEVSAIPVPVVVASKRENKAEELDQISDSALAAPQTLGTVLTKSGRASKPSTPAQPTFQEAARSRPSRNTEPSGNAKKLQQKKGSSIMQTLLDPMTGENGIKPRPSEDDEGEADADEPTYCYCNSVSYGEMVACDSDDCAREWFHLACVGLKVAPGSKTKWYCEDCKERLKMGGKKVGNR